MKVLHYVDDNVLSWAHPYIQLLRALRDLGCENVMVCRPHGTLSSLLSEAGFEVHCYRPLFGTIPQVAINFQKIVRAVQPDIIHTRLSSAANIGGMYGKKLNIPVLATIDKFPNKKYYLNADLLLPCSTPVAKFMASQGIPEQKMIVIPNAVDVKSYAKNSSVRDSLRKAEGLTDDNICFLGMGRFVDWKGFDDLLRGFAEFVRGSNDPEKFVLWLAGDGPEYNDLQSLSYKLEINNSVKFWKFVDDVKPLLWGADVYIHPSWGDEAFGLSLLEAMSAGLPVIASQSGGMTEILNDSQGLLFPRRDIETLAECMRESVTKAEALSLAALSRAWDFDVKVIAQKTLDVYENILRHA